MSQNREMGHPGSCWVECGELRVVLSHPKRDTTALRMGHPGSCRVECGELRVVLSHPKRDTTALRMGHPGSCRVECGELRVVLSHPKRDTTALRMGHPGSCRVECGELRVVLSHPKRDTTALRMGHPGFAFGLSRVVLTSHAEARGSQTLRLRRGRWYPMSQNRDMGHAKCTPAARAGAETAKGLTKATLRRGWPSSDPKITLANSTNEPANFKSIFCDENSRVSHCQSTT